MLYEVITGLESGQHAGDIGTDLRDGVAALQHEQCRPPQCGHLFTIV